MMHIAITGLALLTAGALIRRAIVPPVVALQLLPRPPLPVAEP
jgi:hypothetical protein